MFILFSQNEEGSRRTRLNRVNEINVSSFQSCQVFSNNICRLTIKTTTPTIPHNSCVLFVPSRHHAHLQSSTNHLKCILRLYTCTEDDSAPLTINQKRCSVFGSVSCDSKSNESLNPSAPTRRLSSSSSSVTSHRRLPPPPLDVSSPPSDRPRGDGSTCLQANPPRLL